MKNIALLKRNHYKRLIPYFIAVADLAALLTVLLLFRKNAATAEWFSRNIARFISSFMGRISSLFPFSLFEAAVIITIAVLLKILISGIRKYFKKQYFSVITGLLILTVTGLSILNFYTMSAGFMYYRAPPPIPMSSVVYRDEQVTQIYDYFLADYIELNEKLPRDGKGNVISPYSVKELSDLLKKEYKRLDDTGYFFKYSAKVKTIENSWFLSSARISGITFLPLGEPTVNKHTPPSDLPQVMAHEMAHAKGVMRENEAEFISLYVLLTSKDDYLRYCGYFSYFWQLYSAIAIGNNLDYNLAYEYYNKIPAQISAEQTNARSFWAEYKGPFHFVTKTLDSLARFFNDLYLKLNGAKEGEGSYNNPSDAIDTGQTKPGSEPGTVIIIYDPVYSNIQKIFFHIWETTNLI